MMKRLVVGAIASILGSLGAMHFYLSSYPNRVSREQVERAYWVSVQTGVGSAFTVTLALLIQGIWFDKSQKDEEREAVLRFAKLKAGDRTLPASEQAQWIATAEELASTHQPTESILEKWRA